MARIALVCHQPNSIISQIALLLAEQKNEVLILTRQDFTDDYFEKANLPNLKVFRSFKNWGISEIVKVFPYLVQFRPDVLHFYLDQESKKTYHRFQWARMFLGTVFKTISVANFQNSFTDQLSLKSQISVKYFLKNLDLVITESRKDLIYLKRKNLIEETLLTEVLTPVLNSPFQTPENAGSEQQKSLASYQPYVFIPQISKRHFPQTPDATSGELNFITNMERTETDLNRKPHVIYLNEFSDEDLISNAKAVLISHLKLNVTELTYYLNFALKYKVPVIASSEQVRILPGIALHNKTGWIIESDFVSFLELINLNSDLKINYRHDLVQKQNWQDSYINQLNRQYSLALQKKGVKGGWLE